MITIVLADDEKMIRAGLKKILQENIEKLHELAKYLLEKETITGDEFMRILNG